MTDKQTSDTMPRGVSIFLAIVAGLDYVFGALIIFEFLALFSYIKFLPYITIALVLLSSVTIFMSGYGIIARKKWVIPMTISGIIVAVISLLYTVFEFSSVLNSFLTLGMLVLQLISLAYIVTLSFFLYKYRNNFSGEYVHPIFSSIFFVLFVFGIISTYSSLPA